MTMIFCWRKKSIITNLLHHIYDLDTIHCIFLLKKIDEYQSTKIKVEYSRLC